MRIALVTCVYPPYRSGIGNSAAAHARHLTALGHEVTVFCPAHDDPPGWDDVDGIDVERLRPLIRHGNSALVPQLWGRMKGFDTVYIMYPFFGGAEFAAAGARWHRVPYVVFFHMDVIWDGWRGNALSAYERRVEPRLMRGAAAVFVSSHEYAESRSIGRITGLRTRASPYSLDLSRFAPPAAPDERAAPPAILIVCAMDEGHAFKGVPQLIEAFGRVREEIPCQLVLVGDGALRDGFERLARATGHERDIQFLGRVDDDALARAYRSASVTVLPSTTAEEAFGIVLIEAMACGCALVGSDLPGVASVIRSAGGVVVPPGDVTALAQALRGVLSDPARQAALSASALSGVHLYRPEAERERLDVVFSAIEAQR